MGVLRLGLVQISARAYELDDNLKRALSLAKKACAQGAKIIVFPELFDCGYCVSDKDEIFGIDLKKASSNPSFKALSEFARTNEVYIIACSIEKEGKKLYDTAFILSPRGKLVGKHRKIYLFNTEKKRFQRGKKYKVFDLKFKDFCVKTGLQICYELGFGEGARALALKGADLLIYPSAFGKARTYNWDLLSRVRALENGCFVVACGLSGTSFDEGFKEKLEFAGRSRIISPKGRIIKEVSENEAYLVCELDLSEVEAQRRALTYLKDFDVKMLKKAFKGIK
ncbi:carbon-nitrogen hydrolase family protein [Campylobacter troglodytis]|uniref:carbon-nitrogen hydrolase family protein n=1 Tax=Campylobacter troglodytis TaxID=654363 RepID=UPI00115B8E7F|nr:carbon-nitrogen hydrolase family protein [Campylobacter troglodytis]TQR60419.1 carbon-nitrogen hydrolase family protein [Campylobacter troglodytis]